jgi:tight adherence protein B
MTISEMLPFLIVFAVVFVTIAGVWFFISSRLSRRREQLQRRLADSDSETLLSLDDELKRRDAAGQRWMSGFEEMIGHTGMDLAPSLAMGIILLCGVALAGFVYWWRFDEEPWLAIPAFFVGASVPWLFFAWLARRWRRKLQDQLPDALFLLSRSLRAGRSIDQSIELVAQEGVAPIKAEFNRVHRQMQLGLPLGDALRSVANRVRLIDFSVFASVVSLHRSTGGNLPFLVDRLAAATRDRNQFEGQYRAATVLGRYSAALIVIMVLVILGHLFFYQKDWVQRFFASGTGITLFVSAICLEIAGGMLLYWFLRHDY